MMNMTSIIDHKWPKPSALFLHLWSPPLYSACLLPAAWIVAALSVWAPSRTKRQLGGIQRERGWSLAALARRGLPDDPVYRLVALRGRRDFE